MIFLAVLGFALGGAAIYGALYGVPRSHHAFKLKIGLGVLSVYCFIGIKKIYENRN